MMKQVMVLVAIWAMLMAVPAQAVAQGAITNGANHPGAIAIAGEIDEWTFTAAQGDAMSLSIGEVLPAVDPTFSPWIRLIGPTGALIESSAGALVAQIDVTAPLSGIYTVRVSTSDNGNDATGSYQLTLAQTPGAFVVPAGDEGGPLINGENHAGRIHLGDLDQWTFVAAQGDAISLSIGEVFEGEVDPGLVPWIRLRSPTGELLDSEAGALVAQIDIPSAPLAGLYTVVVSTFDNSNDATGLYRLTLARTPGSFVVPVGDEGGALVNGVATPGVIHLGDIDQWTFTASQGSTLTVSISEVVQVPDPGLVPWIRLRGPTGVLLDSESGALAAQINVNAPVTGLYTVLTGTNDTGHDATGSYLVSVAGATSIPVPTTEPDAYATTINAALAVAAPGVLGNDTGNGGGALMAELVTGVSSGTLTFNADGSFTFTPATGFTGVTSFTYRAVHSGGVGNTATVTLTVGATSTALPPTGLYAASIAGNTVTLRWTPPPGGLPPTDYVLEGGVNPGDVLASIPVGSTSPIYTFVAPTGAFFVRMHTMSGANRSAPSNEIRILVNVPAAPSAPANLLGLVNGSSIALAWRNTFEGGAPGGLVLDVSGALSTSIPLGLTDSFAFNGVPGGAYTLAVRAVNASGSSPPSNAITLTFPGVCSGAPLTPAGFLAYRQGNTIFVTWDPATSGPAPTSYSLNVSGAFAGTFGTAGRNLSGTVGPGSYQLNVAAVNACGSSAVTSTQTVVIP
jgi:hypothetical protein